MAYTNTVGSVVWLFNGHNLMLGKCMTCGARIKVRLAGTIHKEDHQRVDIEEITFNAKHRHEE